MLLVMLDWLIAPIHQEPETSPTMAVGTDGNGISAMVGRYGGECIYILILCAVVQAAVGKRSWEE